MRSFHNNRTRGQVIGLFLFSSSGDYTKIRQCRLGINRRGLPSLNIIRISMFKLLSTSEDLKFKHPFAYIVSGSSGSGKSSLCKRFLQKLDELCSERNFVCVVTWCYSEKRAAPNHQLTILKNQTCYNESVTSDFDNELSKPCFIIPEDLLNDVYSKDVCDLFTKSSHHRNYSSILIIQ